MSELLRRFHYPLTYLALALLCVIGITARPESAPLGLGSRLLLDLTVPLQQMVTLPVREVQGFWREYVALLGLREENEQLRAQLARLEEENLQYREAIVSSERFQRLDDLRARGDVPMVPANVIGQDLSAWFQSVIIDRGSADEVRAGMPVITDSGAVGVVAGTTPGAAKVLAITDPQSRVDAYVQRTRARGTVRGTSREGSDFAYVLRDADVREGDVLLTSGLGGIYPKGLIIGRIGPVERKPYGLFQRADVVPAVDFRQLEEVFVILERREVPDAAAFSSGAEALWSGAPE